MRSGAPGALGSCRALVVLDDAEHAEAMATAGAELGLEVTRAVSVADGLAAWPEGTRIVFIGASLADEAGPLLEKAQASGAQVRAVGGAERGDEILRLLKGGALGYVPMPQTPAGLTDEIRRILAYEDERRYEDTGTGRAKRELQAVFDTFPSPLVVLGSDMTIRRANKAAFTMAGRASPREVIGASACDVFPDLLGVDGSPVARAVRANLPLDEEGEAPAGEDKDAPRQVCHCRVFPGEADADGLADGALVLMEDVTRRRREEAQHAQTQRLQAVALLAATLSHEINQPLGAIMGRSQLAQMNLEQPEPDRAVLKRDLDEIVQCVRRVSRILEKLHRVTDIVTKPYLGETEILDLERSAGAGPDTLASDAGPARGAGGEEPR
ncbi:MAG: PAS domain-containing protein [Planctomycetota bacterium]